jgi:Ca2+-binding RTX toxin-like protein
MVNAYDPATRSEGSTVQRSAWPARAGLALVTAVSVGALMPTPAHAASAGVASVVESTKVNYKAAKGKQNKVVVTLSGRTVTIDDVVAVKAGAGCTAVKGDKTKVRCTTKAAPTRVRVYTYDRNDSIVNQANLPSTLNGGTGNDSIGGGPRGDLITGDAGNDKLWGNGGNDTIYPDIGNDVVRGGAGNDEIMDAGGKLSGNDWLSGDDGTDTLWGFAGNDHLYGNSGDDLLFGGQGSDYLDGGYGDDYLLGNSCDFPEAGGCGATDTLIGGPGNNQIVKTR